MVLPALMSSTVFHISTLTRPATPRANFPPSVPLHISDYMPASLAAAFAGQGAVISPIAGAAVLEQKKMTDAAVQVEQKQDYL